LPELEKLEVISCSTKERSESKVKAVVEKLKELNFIVKEDTDADNRIVSAQD